MRACRSCACCGPSCLLPRMRRPPYRYPSNRIVDKRRRPGIERQGCHIPWSRWQRGRYRSAGPGRRTANPGGSAYRGGQQLSAWVAAQPVDSRRSGIRARALSRPLPDIDLVFHGAGGTLEYNLEVAPGADPLRIRLRYRGASSPSIRPAISSWSPPPAGWNRNRLSCIRNWQTAGTLSRVASSFAGNLSGSA